MNARGNSLLVEEKERNKVNKALPKLEKELQDLIQGRFFQTGFNNYVHLLDGSCWKRCHPLHTEWQRLISGVQSIMMEKSALVGKAGGCPPTPFHSNFPSRTKLQWTLQLRGQLHFICFISS
jgi:hypothetical protein